MMCDYCGKERGNKPLVRRASRTVEVEKANDDVWGLFMWWSAPNGKRHMEWTFANYCPMCGRRLNEEVCPA